MKLTLDQIKILREGELDGNKFYLQWQLDRKQYVSINEVLETIGLKRNRKEKAHIADCTSEELEEAIADIIETGEVETLKETIKKFQFYETPKEVAEYLVELADIWEFDNVLEPSAWHGAIIKEIRKKKYAFMEAVEIDPVKYNHLYQELFMYPTLLAEKSRFVDDRLTEWDFLHYDRMTFDKIIANPPFSKSQDVKHILKMYEILSEWGRLVSVASASIKTRQGKLYDELRELNPEYYDLPDWSFKESGTMVNTVIVVINK